MRKNARLSIAQFALWNALAFYHAAVYFFGVYAVVRYARPLASNGLMYGVFDVGTVIYTACVIGVNIKVRKTRGSVCIT